MLVRLRVDAPLFLLGHRFLQLGEATSGRRCGRHRHAALLRTEVMTSGSATSGFYLCEQRDHTSATSSQAAVTSAAFKIEQTCSVSTAR
jgi:hypothetical protein